MAVPIFGAIFGALGIEAAKEVAGAVDSALAALFGRRVSEVMEEVADRVRGYTGGVPTNHDLERTLRLLQLTSTLLILRAYEIADETDRFDQRGTAPPPFIKATHDWLRDQIGLCPRMTVRANETLVEKMERALDGLLRSGDPSAAARQRIAEVEAAAWAELAAGVPDLPAEFRARFMGQTESIPGWRDVFRELVREALKERPRVKIAFDISRLAALRDDSARMGTVLDALAGDAAALRALPQIAADTAATRRNMEELRHDQQRLPAEIVEQLMAAMEARGHVARAQEEGLERRTILALAKRLRNEDAPDLDQAIAALDQAVDIALATIRRGERASNEDAFVDQVLAQVARQTRDGAFDAAARTVDDGLAELDRREAEQRDSFRRSRASLLEAGMAQDTLRRDATAIARRIEALVALDNAERPAWTAAFQARWDALYEEGTAKGVNFSLEVAAALAARMRAIAATPDERGVAGNLLGNALATLGERESGTARLEEAVAAYRLALEESTRDRVPLDWAMTQNNLGNALQTLGARESGTARLEEAVAAYRLALEEWTRDRVPLNWATTQNNLGTALAALGERESGTARLEEAVAAYRLALEERGRDRVPLNWATTQSNLGTALAALGARENGTARLEEAVAAYRLALEERTRDRVPLDWATTQNNLGSALRTLGARESGTARLEEAVAAYRLALQEWTRDRVPLDWATTQNNLGNALATLGARESGTARLEEAVAAYRLALQEWTRDRLPLDWATTQNNLGNALATLGGRESGTARLEEAVAAYRLALEERTRTGLPYLWALTMENLALAEEAFGEREAPRGHWSAALRHVEDALEEYHRAGADYDIGTATTLRDRLLARLAALPD
ncbi:MULTISPECIES: tetratricopeptide repeat protein [Roseomonadaceae]|uniref:Tetratricopeptide repeat protein n=1 Tax=Falsiroseomonas oleicola TaxID=2801474 RepID=A0ABS6H923_9PROT|nr:tetratricopeptide repeat protein [Roseomonas oleicola]MBU8544468.1 tetratricopeptide repeat protein [Roseomonas oleicola]